MKVVSAKDLDVDSVVEYFDDVVVVPTETVYGLAASIYNPHAVGRIFELKNRPRDNPLIVHVSSVKMAEDIVEGPIPEEYRRIMDRFWPGPVSLLFKAKDCVSRVVRGGLDTVAIRIPKSPCLLRIIERLGTPLAAPSANISGRPSPTTVQHVMEDFSNRIGLVVDDGPCSIGVESTVVSLMEGRITVLRPGGVSAEELEEAVESRVDVRSKTGEDGKVLSPGQKYRHYSPTAPLVLFRGETSNIGDAICSYVERGPPALRVGIATHSDLDIGIPPGRASTTVSMGRDKKEICRNLFGCLRSLDKVSDVILVAGVDYEGEGHAIMDRLERAASEVIMVQ